MSEVGTLRKGSRPVPSQDPQYQSLLSGCVINKPLGGGEGLKGVSALEGQ